MVVCHIEFLMPLGGVDLVVGVRDRHANIFSFLSFFKCFCLRQCPHTRQAYVSFGLIIPVYTHLINFGFGPQYDLVL